MIKLFKVITIMNIFHILVLHQIFHQIIFFIINLESCVNATSVDDINTWWTWWYIWWK